VKEKSWEITVSV